jgi:membrane protein
MLSKLDVGIGWGELVKRTVRETMADDGLSLAAQMAYYFFFALFPSLLFLIALAGVFATEDMIARVMPQLEGTVPPDVARIVGDQLTQISQGGAGGILTFGVLIALWSASAALVAIISATNRAYDVEEARPWWKQRLTAILLTIGLAIFLLLSVVLIVAGPELAGWVARQVGLGAAFEWTWKILQWPLVFALIVTAFGLVYYFAPNVEQDYVWLTPGALLAAILWIAGSLGLRFYIVNFGSYNETYGAIGGVMVLLLWLYVSGFVLFIGAEMNAVLEHASPHGKAAGERVPGERGAAGRREPAASRRPAARPARAPARAPAAVPAQARGASSLFTTYARRGVMLTGAIGALFGRRRVGS